jgi:phenylalanyl-tRNA synthetase alpha chain
MDKINAITLEAKRELKEQTTIHDLEQVKSKYIGKNGLISLLMQELKYLQAEERKEFGLKVNKAKEEFEEGLKAQKEQILALELQRRLESETIDVTLPLESKKGSLHPISLSIEKIVSIFKGFGFEVADGPEIETDYYNFETLNIPKSHPARAMQDTFYTSDFHILRTHTSPVQVRFARENSPPFRVIAPGRVYRVDMDATHSPMFHQVEGLWIDENINFANLKGIIHEFLRSFFEKDNLEVRFRASFFPFTEPSAEIDIKFNDSWLEVAGCGMVHPKVLEHMQIDTSKYNGFAFGIGIDRITMLKYNIEDLRSLFENELDFLKQFTIYS